MVNNSNLINLIENKKPVELVQEIEKHEIKKSPLSLNVPLIRMVLIVH